MSLDTIPVEVRQRIIEHTFPAIVDGALEVCDCLGIKQEGGGGRCVCGKDYWEFFNFQSDQTTRSHLHDIRLIIPPTIVTSHQLHSDTLVVLAKTFRKIATCSARCLWTLHNSAPLHVREMITQCALRFSIDQHTPGGWGDQIFEPAESFKFQMRDLARVRQLWVGKRASVGLEMRRIGRVGHYLVAEAMLKDESFDGQVIDHDELPGVIVY